MYCRQCGAGIPDGMNFCPYCGAAQLVLDKKVSGQTKQRGGKKHWWLIAVCAVVAGAAIAAIAGALFLLPNWMQEDVYLCVREIYHYSDGTMTWSDNIYDDEGNRTGYITYDESGGFGWWAEYTYDEDGNELAHIEYSGDGSISYSKEYTYDKNGNLLTVTGYSYNGDGSIDWWSESNYDKNGNELSYTFYNANGSIDYWDEYTYDQKGNLLTQTEYDDDGAIISWSEYTCDKNGNWLTITGYDADGTISWWNENTYDRKGNWLTETYYNADGTVDFSNEFTYDDNGNEIEWINYNADGSIELRAEYEYMTLDEWNDSAQPVLPTLKTGETVKIVEEAEDTPVVESVPVDDTLEDYKEYVAVYAAASAPNADEMATVDAYLVACTTADEVENCPYLTPLYINEVILYYSEWIAAGCPYADPSNMAMEPVFEAVTGDVMINGTSVTAYGTFTMPDSDQENAYAYGIECGPAPYEMLRESVDFGETGMNAQTLGYEVCNAYGYGFLVPGATYYYWATIRVGNEPMLYYYAQGEAKSFTAPEYAVESILLGQEKTVSGVGGYGNNYVCYCFTPTESGNYMEAGADSIGQWQGWLAVFDSDGFLISQDVGENGSLVFTATAGEKYYISLLNSEESPQTFILTAAH